jgi:glycosyltransferase involved in cell wall biosynthesis
MQYGGVERVMLNLATGFAQIGFSVDLVVADARGHLLRYVPNEVSVVNLGSSRVLASLPALVKYLRKERPATLISGMDHSNVVALWARKLSGAQTRIIATVHANLSGVLSTSSRLRVRLLPLFMRHCYPWADEIVAVSNGVADDLAEQTGVPRQKVKVIYNPVLCGELFEKAREPARHSWFTPNQPPVVLGVGRLEVEKGFDVLIRAFARVRQQRPARLMILGEGNQRPKLEALSRELGVDEDVCLPGYQWNPYAYMTAAQVFVLASRYEGFGLVLIEALALGLPIVSTDCESGPREILQDGRYGALVPVGSVESLASAILSTLDRGKQPMPWDWLRHFEVGTVVDAYKELFASRRQSNITKQIVSQSEA